MDVLPLPYSVIAPHPVVETDHQWLDEILVQVSYGQINRMSHRQEFTVHAHSMTFSCLQDQYVGTESQVQALSTLANWLQRLERGSYTDDEEPLDENSRQYLQSYHEQFTRISLFEVRCPCSNMLLTECCSRMYEISMRTARP